MRMKEWLDKRKNEPGPKKEAIADAVTLLLNERAVAMQQYHEAKVAQLGNPNRAERDMMETHVQMIGGASRLLEEAMQRLTEAHANIALIEEREVELRKLAGP